MEARQIVMRAMMEDLVSDRIVDIETDTLYAAPENEQVYHAIVADAPDMQALIDSVIDRGILEPLVVSEDRYILSGHRRHVAALEAGLDVVPCRIVKITQEHPGFLGLLIDYNRQRVKGVDELLREQAAEIGPAELWAYGKIATERQESFAHRRDVGQHRIRPGEKVRRCRISRAKQPFAEAIKSVLADRKEYWPVSVRAVHYGLLNVPGLMRSVKTGTSFNSGSPYQNDRASYQDLSGMLTRLRLTGEVPWDAVTDETRPARSWRVWPNPADFIREQVEFFLDGYSRDPLASQRAYVEVFCEKLTMEPIIRPVCAEYGLPYSIGRGFTSIDARHELVERYRSSGKAGLTVLCLSDFDPDGEGIAENVARSLRDDFGERGANVIKVALTQEQAKTWQLPNALDAKPSSPRYKRFVREHASADSWELEAVPPAVLQEALRGGIESVLDLGLLEAERNHQADDRRHIIRLKLAAGRLLGNLAETGEQEGDSL